MLSKNHPSFISMFGVNFLGEKLTQEEISPVVLSERCFGKFVLNLLSKRGPWISITVNA